MKKVLVAAVLLASACAGNLAQEECAFEGWSVSRIYEDGHFQAEVTRTGRDGLPFRVEYAGSSVTAVHCQDAECRTSRTQALPDVAVRGHIAILTDSERPPVIALAQGNVNALTLIRCSDDPCSTFTSQSLAFAYDSWMLAWQRGDVVIVASTRPDACARRRLDLLRCTGDDCSRAAVSVLVPSYRRTADAGERMTWIQ